MREKRSRSFLPRLLFGSVLLLGSLAFAYPALPAAAPGEEKSGKDGKGETGKKAEGPPGSGSKKGAAAKDAGSGKASGGEEAPAPRQLSEIEKEMRKAQAVKDFAKLGALAAEALDLKDPAAVKAVILYALQGEDRDLELKVFQKLIAMTDPASNAVIWQEASKNPNFKTRIILLGVAYQKKDDPGAFGAIAKALKDTSRPVVLTSIRWLRSTKDPERAVPPLIEALKATENFTRGRVYYDIVNALRDLTGISNLECSADWKNYWETRKAGGAPKPRKSVTVVVRPKMFGTVSIESEKVLFMIDCSGSMLIKDPPLPKDEKPEPATPGKTVVPKTRAPGGKKKLSDEERDALPRERERMYRVKMELVRLIRELPKNVNFTVLSFNHQTAFIGDSPVLLQANEENKKKAIDWVNSMKAEGETWTDTAFERAFNELKEMDTIYFLSDGFPYRNAAKIPEGQVREGIKNQNRFAKCRIHTFGFLQEGPNLQAFLKKLAAENDGTYTPLE